MRLKTILKKKQLSKTIVSKCIKKLIDIHVKMTVLLIRSSVKSSSEFENLKSRKYIRGTILWFYK